MLPSNEIRRTGNILNLSRELVERCSVSQTQRRDASKRWRTLFHTGSSTGDRSKVNLVHNYIDKLASLLFSPSDVRFELSFDADETAEWTGAADLAARHINRQFKARKCNTLFSSGLEVGLVESCSFIKLNWGRHGYTPHLIRQQFMGVEREDLNDFADQDVITHTYFLTEHQFARLLGNHRDKREIMLRVGQAFTERGVDEAFIDTAPGSYLHEIVVGGTTTGVQDTLFGSGSAGSVSVFGPPQPRLSPNVSSRLIQVVDIWIMNDEMNDGAGGWGTIRYCEPGIIIEGEHAIRNLGDIPGELPFFKISPNEQPGYFWGMSELAWVSYIEEWFSARVQNVDDIFALRARPPRSFEGYSGLTAEKMRALLTRGGVFTSDAPAGTTRIQAHAPDMPPEAMTLLNFIHSMFDEAGGMTPILSGQGEAGVRSGSQAATLLRTSTPRLRDKATLVESQLADFGELCYEMSRAKDARVFQVPSVGDKPPGRQFTLSQLPEDAMVNVDSHSSSPAFSGDNLQLAFALFRSGVIDGEDLLQMSQPPHSEELILKWRAREAEKAKFLQAHPELVEKGAKGRGRK